MNWRVRCGEEVLRDVGLRQSLPAVIKFHTQLRDMQNTYDEVARVALTHEVERPCREIREDADKVC